MKKGIYINLIIRNLIIMFFLFWVLSNNDGLVKFMIIPFIICLLISIMKSICIIFDKDKYASIFNKMYVFVFLFFAFSFIVLWSYVVIKKNNYVTILFTIPFWIMGIYFIRKCFLKKNLYNKSNSKFNVMMIIPFFLVLIVLAVGLFCLFMGIKETYIVNRNTKDYLTTTAYFKDYEIFDSTEKWEDNNYNKHTTYRLIYTYKVDNKEYIIKTDYGSGYIPKINSERKIKYDPNNPSHAVLVDMNRNTALIYFGIFFTLGGMTFVLIFLQTKGLFDRIKTDVIGLYIGILFTIIGIGIIFVQNAMTSSFIETIKVMNFWILIPLMFIGVGILLTIKILFFKNRKIDK